MAPPQRPRAAPPLELPEERAFLAQATTDALAPVAALGQLLESEQGVRYLGIDASIAPSLEGPSIPGGLPTPGPGPDLTLSS